MSSFYAILELEVSANHEAIKRQYKKLALKFHPDRVKNVEGKESATERFKAIGEAYETLSDPIKKRDYDNTITMGISGGSGISDYSEFVSKQRFSGTVHIHRPSDSNYSEKRARDTFDSLFDDSWDFEDDVFSDFTRQVDPQHRHQDQYIHQKKTKMQHPESPAGDHPSCPWQAWQPQSSFLTHQQPEEVPFFPKHQQLLFPEEVPFFPEAVTPRSTLPGQVVRTSSIISGKAGSSQRIITKAKSLDLLGRTILTTTTTIINPDGTREEVIDQTLEASSIDSCKVVDLTFDDT